MRIGDQQKKEGTGALRGGREGSVTGLAVGGNSEPKEAALAFGTASPRGAPGAGLGHDGDEDAREGCGGDEIDHGVSFRGLGAVSPGGEQALWAEL